MYMIFEYLLHLLTKLVHAIQYVEFLAFYCQIGVLCKGSSRVLQGCRLFRDKL
jgi:hypothetical protein